MRRCRTKKNKKWWVQLIQQRPRPARSGTWCILWRFWTQSLTHGPSVNIHSYWLLPLACILICFSFIAYVIPSCIVSWDSSCALSLFLRGEMVRSRWERELKTCMIQNIVQLLLSSAITHFSLPNVALLTTCEYRWVTNDRTIFLWSCSHSKLSASVPLRKPCMLRLHHWLYIQKWSQNILITLWWLAAVTGHSPAPSKLSLYLIC